MYDAPLKRDTPWRRESWNRESRVELLFRFAIRDSRFTQFFGFHRGAFFESAYALGSPEFRSRGASPQTRLAASAIFSRVG